MPPQRLFVLIKVVSGVLYKVPTLSAKTTTFPEPAKREWVVANEFLKAPETSNLTVGAVKATPTLPPLICRANG